MFSTLNNVYKNYKACLNDALSVIILHVDQRQTNGTLGSEKFTRLMFGEFGIFGKQADVTLSFSKINLPN